MRISSLLNWRRPRAWTSHQNHVSLTFTSDAAGRGIGCLDRNGRATVPALLQRLTLEV